MHGRQVADSTSLPAIRTEAGQDSVGSPNGGRVSRPRSCKNWFIRHPVMPKEDNFPLQGLIRGLVAGPIFVPIDPALPLERYTLRQTGPQTEGFESLGIRVATRFIDRLGGNILWKKKTSSSTASIL